MLISITFNTLFNNIIYIRLFLLKPIINNVFMFFNILFKVQFPKCRRIFVLCEWSTNLLNYVKL